MYRWATLVGGLGVFAIERGLDVSGIQNMQLAIGLWVFGGGLLVASGIMFAWPAIKKRKLALSLPDISIDFPSVIFFLDLEELAVGLKKDGFMFIFNDIKIFNRSGKSASIGIKLGIMLGESWRSFSAEKEPILHLGDTPLPPLLNLETETGIAGYIEFFVSKVIMRTIEDFESMEEGEFLMGRQLQLEVNDYISNEQRIFPYKGAVIELPIEEPPTSHTEGSQSQ